MEYRKIGLKNFVLKYIEAHLSGVAEERYDEFLKQHDTLEEITSKTHEKIVDKLSNVISDNFIEKIKA